MGDAARTAAERAADRHASACQTGQADRERSAEEQRRLAGELDEARAAVAAAQQRLAEVTADQANLAGSLPELQEALAFHRAAYERLERFHYDLLCNIADL